MEDSAGSLATSVRALTGGQILLNGAAPHHGDHAIIAPILPVRAGDLVVLWPKNVEHRSQMKRVVMAPPPEWATWHSDSEVVPLIIVEQLNPPRQYQICTDRLAAIHRVLTTVSPNEMARINARPIRRAIVESQSPLRIDAPDAGLADGASPGGPRFWKQPIRSVAEVIGRKRTAVGGLRQGERGNGIRQDALRLRCPKPTNLRPPVRDHV